MKRVANKWIGHRDRVIPANEHELRWTRDREQRATVKAVRLFSRDGGPLHLQVLMGRKWLSIITLLDVQPGPINSQATARFIKCEAKKEGIRVRGQKS